jgi:hypothetical protein
MAYGVVESFAAKLEAAALGQVGDERAGVLREAGR